MGKYVAMDIPDSIVRAYVENDGRKPTAVVLKNILVQTLPKYFDAFGNFKGLEVNFEAPVYIGDGKHRVNTFTRYSTKIDDETWNMLKKAQTYTTISKKNIAEIIILKELLEGEVSENAENRTLHNQQGIEADH